MAQRTLLLLIFFFALVSLNYARNKKAEEELAKKDCSKCDPTACVEPTTVCQAGKVKDVCDCCTVCGKKLGDLCDMDVVNDEKQYFQKPFYTPTQGRCGDMLKCVWHKEDVRKIKKLFFKVNHQLTKKLQTLLKFENIFCLIVQR